MSVFHAPPTMDGLLTMSKETCFACNIGELTPEVHAMTFHDGLVVEGMERYRCSLCDADPVFPDQIRRNAERIKAARAAISALPSHGL